MQRAPTRAKVQVARHLDGPLVLKPLPGQRGEPRAETSGRWKRDGLLGRSEPTGRPFAH